MRRVHMKKMFIMFAAAVLILVGGIRVQAMASSASDMAARKYESIQVHSGDSLWSIAADYCGSDDMRDIRDYVKELKDMNHIINEDNLKSGAYLMIYRID